jgi:hypothetical protein
MENDFAILAFDFLDQDLMANLFWKLLRYVIISLVKNLWNFAIPWFKKKLIKLRNSRKLKKTI